jgi:hypothetical protein
MLHRLLGLIAAAGLAALTGCASITTGTTQEITVSTIPPGADCVFSRETVVLGRVSPTPGTITLDKNHRALEVACSKEGFVDNKGAIRATFQAMTLGNIIFGGLIGVIVDLSTGATAKYEPEITISLIPASFPSLTERDVFFDRMRNIFVDDAQLVRERIQQKCQGAECARQLNLADTEEKQGLVRIEEQRSRAVVDAAAPPVTVRSKEPATTPTGPAGAPVTLDDLRNLLGGT